MSLIEFLIIVIGLVGLYFFQHYRIKHLESKTKDQSELLGNIKTYFDIISPQLMKYRVELLEQTLEKEKNIEIEKMKAELNKALERSSDAVKLALEMIQGFAFIFAQSFVYLPHDKRRDIISKNPSEALRKMLEPLLPQYEKADQARGNALRLAFLQAAEAGECKDKD